MQKTKWFGKDEERIPDKLTNAAEKFETYSKDLGSHIKYAVTDFFTDRTMESKDIETLEKHKKIYSNVARASIGGMITTLFTPVGVLFFPLLVHCQRKGRVYDEYMDKKIEVDLFDFQC